MLLEQGWKVIHSRRGLDIVGGDLQHQGFKFVNLFSIFINIKSTFIS